MKRRDFLKGLLGGLAVLPLFGFRPGTPAPPGPRPEPPKPLTLEEKRQILREYASMPGGRLDLAKRMAAPLRGVKNYESVGRKTFLVEKMPEYPGFEVASDLQIPLRAVTRKIRVDWELSR